MADLQWRRYPTRLTFTANDSSTQVSLLDVPQTATSDPLPGPSLTVRKVYIQLASPTGIEFYIWRLVLVEDDYSITATSPELNDLATWYIAAHQGTQSVTTEVRSKRTIKPGMELTFSAYRNQGSGTTYLDSLIHVLYGHAARHR